MDRNQILSFKASLESELERLETQRAGILLTIESLKKMEASFWGDVTFIEEPQPPKVPTEITAQSRVVSQGRGTTSRARIMNALEKVSGKFSRIELFKLANEDYLPELNLNTFGGIFAELVKKGIVKEVAESSGSQPGTYMKAKEYQTMQVIAPV